MRSKGIKYFLDLTGEDSKNLKSISLKTDNAFKTLSLNNGRYILELTPEELANAPDTFSYTIILKYKNNEKKITGEVILKR